MATTITPRLRVTRHSPVVSASHSARLPEFSQLVDVSLNDMPTSETTEQQPASRPSTPSTVTRSENPAAVLRALLSRLPPSSPPPAGKRSPSPQDPSERESDYDMSETSHATPSVAQESLRNIFSKARRDPGGTPRKSRPRRNSLDNSEVDASPANDRTRTDRRGKRRSMSDDEVDQTNYSAPKRPSNRSQRTTQPVTMEFLRERFDNSQSSPARPRSSSSNHDSSNETATILLNLSSSPPSPPMATSTPQQSLRMSVNEQFQSNLLDENTEMQHAIEGLESYGESSSGRPVSPPPIMQKRSKSSIDKDFKFAETPRYQSRRSSSQSSLKSVRATPKHHGTNEPVDLSDQGHDWDTQHPRSFPLGYAHSHLDKSGSQSSNKMLRDEGRSPSRQRSHLLLQHLHSNHYGHSSLPSSGRSSHSKPPSRSASPSASSVPSQDDDALEILNERERNWNSPHPVWHNPSPSDSPLPQAAEIGRQRINSLPASPHSREGNNGLSKKRSTPLKSREGNATKSRVSQRSISPLPPEPPSPIPTRSSSLQPSDNTYRHNDRGPLHPGRSPSPLPSFSKKRPASPSTSTTPRKQKTSATILLAREHADPSFPTDEKENFSTLFPSSSREKSNGSSMNLTSIYRHESDSKSLAYLSLNHAREEGQASLNMNEYDHDAKTDDMKETDFSTQGNHTPPLGPVSPRRSELPDEGRENFSQPRLSPRHDSRRSPVTSTTPHVYMEDTSPTRNTFTEVTGSPSTPPRRNTPRKSRIEFKTPSPPRDLPELPSPPSDDESERNFEETPAVNLQSRVNGHHTLQGIPTPRPPGGWYATPKPSRDLHVKTGGDLAKPVHDSWDDSGNEQHYPTTPTNQHETPGTVGKTPKPPGGWVLTPGPPSSSRLPERDIPEQSGGLVTPVASLLKGSFDPKTPGVPGGWLATPAPKKSILKVRFDSEATREESLADIEANFNGSLANAHSVSKSTITSHPESSSSVLPPSPRSPSKSKGPSIRVLDAFGREEGSGEMKGDGRSRSMLRVVDAMGRQVEDTHDKSIDGVQLEELGSRKPSRGDLLSHIRRGLDDLAGELDDIESDDEDSVTEARIEELNTVSKEAREARNRLQRQSLPSEGMKLMRLHPSGSYSLRDRWRFYVVIVLVQSLLFVFVYRLAIRHTRMHLLNAYYDPFNPDVHLYLFDSESSGHFTDSDFPTSWYHLITRYLGGKLLPNFLHFAKDMPSYFWTLWDGDSVSRNSIWLPT